MKRRGTSSVIKAKAPLRSTRYASVLSLGDRGLSPFRTRFDKNKRAYDRKSFNKNKGDY